MSLYAKPSLRFTVGEPEDFPQARGRRHLAPRTDRQPEDLSRLSDGMKSLFYFAIVAAMFDVEQQAATDATAKGASPPAFDLDRLAPAALSVLAAEEPENHIAPQLLGRIIELLKTIASATNGQLVLTSHSPSILSRVDPTDVRHLRLAGDPSTARNAEVREIVLPARTDEAFKYVKEAVRAYPELYFARLVILGEGDSEEVILPRVFRSAGIGLDASLIAVVPLGGRHACSHLCEGVPPPDPPQYPSLLLLDLDVERNGGAPDGCPLPAKNFWLLARNAHHYSTRPMGRSRMSNLCPTRDRTGGFASYGWRSWSVTTCSFRNRWTWTLMLGAFTAV